ncbi:hypothetical protein M9H77_20204 [Catharanthus roseus]|uniref:Uncharacterized protein n=1 Tax=Catharanthus roseus TaxID=4058 RepID=A0ACC0AJI2_CATRO|nr:hypothetical protein M9H77_20204 [Catharanthus roseus]
MASLGTLQLYSTTYQGRVSTRLLEFRTEFGNFNVSRKWDLHKTGNRKLALRALSDSSSSDDGKGIQDEFIIANQGKLNVLKLNWHDPVVKLQETITSLPPLIFLTKNQSGSSFAIGLCAAATLLIILLRFVVSRKPRNNQPGSVADLVRRGQLRSDRRGISTPLKYEDPFNNPLVKVGKGNSTVEMCGKVYNLAPVTLTKEQQAIHQKRRSRAYQWKRPKVFLKEGDSIPPDVDPDTVRWIPANHPFATTTSDIDEDLAQNNVYQKHGVPFRIQAEHEALQKKLEALQNGQKLGKLVLDPGAAKDFERPFKSYLKSEDQDEQSSSKNQAAFKPPSSDSSHNPFVNRPDSEEMQKP